MKSIEQIIQDLNQIDLGEEEGIALIYSDPARLHMLNINLQAIIASKEHLTREFMDSCGSLADFSYTFLSSKTLLTCKIAFSNRYKINFNQQNLLEAMQQSAVHLEIASIILQLAILCMTRVKQTTAEKVSYSANA